MRMKKILFPTTYATSDKVAYGFTQHLARYFEARITLAHVYNELTLADATDRWNGVDNIEEVLWNENIAQLKDFSLDMAAKQFDSISLEYIATDGKVVDQLLQIQEEEQFDLIVMSMYQNTESEQLLGETASQLLGEINCPILLLPPTIKYRDIDKIVYSTALELGDEASIEYLLDWCDAFEASLHLLHVAKKDQEQVANQKLELLLQSFLAEREAGIITAEVFGGRVSEVLLNYVKFTGADLLVLHKRKQGFWKRLLDGDLTQTLAEKSSIPILVLNF